MVVWWYRQQWLVCSMAEVVVVDVLLVGIFRQEEFRVRVSMGTRDRGVGLWVVVVAKREEMLSVDEYY